jgi:hypothetical protein
MAVDYWIGGPDQLGQGVRPGSNLVRQFTDEWPRVDLVRGRRSSGGRSELTAGCHGHPPEMGGPTATVLHSLRDFFIWLWNDAGNSFH